MSFMLSCSHRMFINLNPNKSYLLNYIEGNLFIVKLFICGLMFMSTQLNCVHSLQFINLCLLNKEAVVLTTFEGGFNICSHSA